MQQFILSRPVQSVREKISGATAITFGLALLLLAAHSPSVPVVTAMALVALGATDLTLNRFSGLPTLWPIAILHAVTYCGLYALFVGASLHAAYQPTAEGLQFAAGADLATSTLPMVAVLHRVAKFLQ